MKLLKILEFQTVDMPGAELSIPLDDRDGLYFQIRTSSYSSAHFTTSNTIVPIIMSHSDNSRTNVRLEIAGTTATLTQGYQQAKTVFLYVMANDDWADTSEFTKVYVNGFDIVKVRDKSGNDFDVSKTFANGQIMLKCSITSHPGDYATEIITSNGNSYTTLIDFHEHYVDAEHQHIDYFYAWIKTVVECYKKG